MLEQQEKKLMWKVMTRNLSPAPSYFTLIMFCKNKIFKIKEGQ